MVKSLVKGLLKRKSKEEGKEKPKEEVPDELPPLAEEIVKEEEKKEVPKEEKKEVPKEGKEGLSEKQGFKESKEGSPEELLSLAGESAKEEPQEKISEGIGLEGKDAGKEKALSGTSSGLRGEVGEPSFFSNLLKITKKQGINKKLLSKDLYVGMKYYHSTKSPVNIKSTNRPALEEEVMKRLHELRLVEKKWRDQKDFIEKNRQILLEHEKEVQTKSEELKPLLKKLSFYEDAPVGKYFRSSDGVIAKNVFELLGLLKIMDEKVFKNHMTEDKNDFALWIGTIIGERELAKKLSKVKSKEEMIFILENASMGQLEDVDTRKYFRPKKGAIIKSPMELADALKNMDDDVFSSHVTKDKNEFSNWIREVFKEGILASKIKKVSDKEEMIKILEEYYKK